MKIAGFLILALSLQGAAETKPQPQKSKLNTQIYEQSSEETSFSAVVKVVREVQGENDVFFEGQKGFFTIGPGASQELLIKSQSKRIPVKVFVNMSNRQILRVERGD